MTTYRPYGVQAWQAMNIRSSPMSACRRRWTVATDREIGRYAFIGCEKNSANYGCNSCASLAGLLLQLLAVAVIILSFIASFRPIACFVLLVIGALKLV